MRSRLALLDPETGRMPQFSAEVIKELAGDAEPRESELAELLRRADLDRIAELEQKLIELSTDKEKKSSEPGRKLLGGQAQGQLEAKQMLEMESEYNAALVSELGHCWRVDQRSTKPLGCTSIYLTR